jgi:ABC-2 type transport system permease protein
VAVGVQSLVANADLVSKVYFPREVLALSIVGASLVDLIIGVAVLVPLLAVQVKTVAITALAVIPILVVVLVWTAAVTVLTATVSVFLRDGIHATRLAIQVGFFASPVMYSTAILPPHLAAWSRLNPLAVCINAMREALLFQRWPDWTWLGLHAAGGTALLAIAVVLTRSVEDRMVDVI